MKSPFYIFMGIWIMILPFLGIPGVWRNNLVSLSGLLILLVCIGPSILKKLQTKPKPKKRVVKIVSEQKDPLPQTPPKTEEVNLESKE